MRRVFSVLLLTFAVLLLAGCQTDAFLEVQVDADGGGAVYVAVALDQEAAARSVLYENKAPNVLPIEDLTNAGWRVTGPTQEQDGRIWLRAEKEFSQLDQLTSVVNEVAGADGPFQNFQVERSSSFGERSWQFSGTVDLTQGMSGFSDDGVAAAFAGEALGQPEAVFTEQLGTSLEDAVAFNVIVNLPGDLGTNNGVVGSAGQAAATTTSAPRSEEATSTAVDAVTTVPVRAPDKGAAVVWNPSFADAAPVALDASSSSKQLLPRIWRWAGLFAGVVGAVALLYRIGQTLLDRRRDRRRSVPRPSPMGVGLPDDAGQPMPIGRFGDAGPGDPPPSIGGGPRPVPLGSTLGTSATPGRIDLAAEEAAGRAANGNGADGSVAPADGSRGLSLIVIETTGALLTGRDPVGDVLVPFCRERGCVLSVRQIADLYLARVVGGMSSADFWTGLGLPGDPMLLDDAYARRFELTDHVTAFLSQARSRGVSVAAVGDDVPEWTSVYRQRFKLDGLIGSWVCSAEVGVRVPHPALLESTEKATGVAPAQAMVIAASRSLLDAAGRLGYRTVQYNPGPDDPDSEHPVLRSFAERGRPTASSSATK